MRQNKDGSFDFIKKGVIYRFRKDNYDVHIKRRSKITPELKTIEETILNPDCITAGPKPKSKRNFYKVLSYHDDKKTRYITFWKIPVFYKNKRLRIIATCIYTTSPNYYVINDLEKVIWKKPGSQI